MRKLRTIIVDDEPLARELLRAMLEEEADIEIVDECGNGREALAGIRDKAPDLVFLDIEMPGMNGFEVLEAVGADLMPIVVFVTAYDQHAIRAFEIHAADYLLKPFNDERLRMTLDRARGLMKAPETQTRPHSVALFEDLLSRERYRNRLTVKEEGKAWFLPVAEIDWLEAEGKFTRAHRGTQSILLKQGISRLEEQLDPQNFVRVNRSAIVRIDRVKEIQRWFKGEHLLILSDGTQLTTGKSYRRLVENALGVG